MIKKSVLVSLVSLALLSTACTPPIPPDVLASYAEQEVLCANGEVIIKGSENTQNVLQSGIDLYKSSCPEAQVTIDNEAAESNIVVTDNSAAEPEMCNESQFKTSLMNQFSTLAYYGEGLDGILLSPNAVAGLLTGEITNWNDSLIAESNPEFELPSIPVTFVEVEKLHASDQAFIDWISTITGKTIEIKPSKVVPDFGTLLADFGTLNGVLSILPSNVIYDNALTYANLKINEQEFLFESTAFASAASQVFIKQEDGNILGVLDPEVRPATDIGTTEVSNSWHGISYYDFGLCKDDASNSARTFMRFLTRLDAQGQFETYGYFPLTEPLRVKVAGKIGEKLPTPSFNPEDLAQN
jgi:ABC-type phosphate transport system substrate-binding protein